MRRDASGWARTDADVRRQLIRSGLEAVDMSEVECPMDGCDYTGEPDSVEGHISAMRDDAHQGETGSQHRHLFAPGDDTEGGATDETTESATEPEVLEDVADAPGSGGPRSADRDTSGDDGSDGAGFSPLLGALPGVAVTAGAAAEAADGGAEMEVDWVTLGIGVAVVVVVAWLLLRDGDSSSEPTTVEPEEDREEFEQAGGLI
jgi:hypothetical protein